MRGTSLYSCTKWGREGGGGCDRGSVIQGRGYTAVTRFTRNRKHTFHTQARRLSTESVVGTRERRVYDVRVESVCTAMCTAMSAFPSV